MTSKFNILILEDDDRQRKELKEAFTKEFKDGYKIFICETIEELLEELSKRYYLGMSLDHKVPFRKGEPAKKYDIDIINRLHRYHPLGYQSIYTAFPEWDSARNFGSTINYIAKKELSSTDWAKKFNHTVTKYKTAQPDDSDIYNRAKEVLFFPFSAQINSIINDFDNIQQYYKLFVFSIEMFYIILSALLIKKSHNNFINIDKQLLFIKENIKELKNKKTFYTNELYKVLDEDFIDDMQILYHKLKNNKWSSLDDECQNRIALLLLKLNFFSANSFAIKTVTRRNYLRQIEIEVEKIENRAFTTKEYITNFDAIPQNNASIYFIFKDYNGKSYFLDIGDYLEITTEEIGNIKIISKLSNRQIFPME